MSFELRLKKRECVDASASDAAANAFAVASAAVHAVDTDSASDTEQA